MGPPLQQKGQREKKDLMLVDFQGVNVQAQRLAIRDNQFSWLENVMPIGPGNLKVTPQVSAPLAFIGNNSPVQSTMSANLNGTDFVFAFTSLGGGWAINLEAYAGNPQYTRNQFAPNGTFSSTGVVATAWNNERLMIGDPNKGLFSWDTHVLLGNGQAAEIDVVDGGFGYTSTPGVSFTLNGGARATVTVNSGQISGITLIDGGSDYTSAPTVSFVGGGGIGATATATISGGVVNSITVTNVGAGYGSPPTVIFNGGVTGGSGLAATAVLTNTAVSAINITNPGTGYTNPPNVIISGGGLPVGSGATATAAGSGGAITSITVTNGGSGYTSPPQVVLSGGGYTVAATAHAVLSGSSVSSIVVDSGGSGYQTLPTVGLIPASGFGGAQATVALLAGPTNITAIAAFASRLWCAFKRTINFSDVNSYSSFAGAGGSFTISDQTLYGNITQLIAANSFLYIFGSSSVDILGNVAVNGGVTSFSRTNVTASIGSNLPFTCYAYYRALVFANQIGFYALSGATPEKISDDLDRLYNEIDFTMPVSGGQVALNKILCTAFLFTFTDNFVGTGQERPMLALFFNKKWFFASQASPNPLTLLCPVDLNGVPVLFGWDNDNNLYQLFFDNTSLVSSTVQTKLYDGQNLLLDKGTQKVGIGVNFNSSLVETVNVSVDGEKFSTAAVDIDGGNVLQFQNNNFNNIYFTNNAGARLIFTINGFDFLMTDFQINNEKYVGLTITSQAAGLIYTSMAIEYEDGASW